MTTLFERLETTRERPHPFGHYTSPLLWNDPHISKGMLEAHLDQSNEAASHPEATIDASVDWIASSFGLSERTKVCDFGCGPGLWTTRFAQRGASVTGVDLSERSIGYARDTARQRGLDISYVLQDYLEFSTEERFDLITMIQCDFSALGPEQRAVILQTFHKLLCADGRLLIDVSSMAYFQGATEDVHYQYSAKDGYWSPGPHHVFTRHFKYEPEQVLCDKYTVADRAREFDVYVFIQCYTLETLTHTFEQHGLRIEACYSDMSGSELGDDSPRIVVVATHSR
ncbi:MAG: class I SAM-dependent methyltransferase [Gemmatimonadetes bacterium]|jgi:SAM-dependent methyltransferase|nr:class I SAM-dependent methyltransferase [Gemmatimonadota bacterium]